MTNSNNDEKHAQDEGKERKYTVPALEAGLKILELLSNETGLSLTDIAKNIDKSTTSTFRMLASLRNEGYVEYSSQHRLYRLSHKLFKISHQHAPLNKLSMLATPILKTLSNTIKNNCFLSMYSQGGTLIMERFEPANVELGLYIGVGSDGALMGSAAGHVILSYATEQEQEEMVNDAVNIRGDKIDKKNIDKISKRVLDNGFETMPSSIYEGVTEFAFPIFNQYSQLAAALSVSTLNIIDKKLLQDRLDIAAHLKVAAQDISAAMGYVE